MRVAPMTSRFLDACRRRPTDVRPVWFMRQAGRYLKQYRQIRERHGILEICKRPDLAAAVTLHPVELLDVDAAIIFADLLLPVEPMGLKLRYAVDRMVDVLRQKGVKAALVAGSGSSMYGLGSPPNEPRGWRVLIKDPWHPERTITELFLKDMSMSTSGSYEKFFAAEGRTYSHIMDPRTGYPAQGSASVSVVSPRTIDSEAWAKPYFVNGRQWAAQHKPKEFRVYFCEDRTDQPCAWLP